MNLNTLFNAIDRKPFWAFTVELVSDRRIDIPHPDNIFILPNRQTVQNIEVYGPGPTQAAMFGPEGIAGVFFDGNGGSQAAE